MRMSKVVPTPYKQSVLLNIVLSLRSSVASAESAPASYGCDHKFQMKKVIINEIFPPLNGYMKTSHSSSLVKSPPTGISGFELTFRWVHLPD